jgi:Domain of unknown function (DUF5047)
MWTGGLNARYRDALAAGATASIRVDITDPSGVPLLSDVSFSAGQVQATLQSRVVRTLSLTVDRSLFPVTTAGSVDYGAPLAPVGNRAKVYRGIQYGDGSIWPPPYGFPVFAGCIETVALDQSGAVKVTANDLANEIVTADFETPMNSIPGNSVNTEFQRLVLDGLPSATFGTSDTIHLAVGQLTWATDRAQALDDILKGSSALWYPLADGSFVQRFTPWTLPGRQPVATFTDGVAGTALGTLGQHTITISRTGVLNSVVYVSDRQDGLAALRAVARDTNPASPTYIRGKFGKKVGVISNQGASTQGQVNTAALNELRKAQALGFTWNPIGIVPDASLELGDLVTLRASGVSANQVVVAFTVPLRESGAMTVSTRAYTPLS